MKCGIYKITNLINNKCYIGYSKHIELRWKQHKKIPNIDVAIYQAMRKYGLENFLFEVIEECPKEQLQEREKYWIKYYNSYSTGYNETLGGDGAPGAVDKPVVQYSLKGEYIQDFPSIAEAVRITGIKNISGVCNNKKKTAGQYQWFFKGQENPKDYTKVPRGQSKPIEQYTLDGKYIKTFISISEAQKALNVKTFSNIAQASKDFSKSAYGFRWKRVN